jgi:glycosyltransferase involved in cell wall biosynthesis
MMRLGGIQKKYLFLRFPIAKNEVFGVALADAKYCQATLVIFTLEGSGVNKMSIDNEIGLEVENKDVNNYAEVVKRLLRDDELRAALGKNTDKRVKENLTMSVVQQQLSYIYSDLCLLR